MWAKLIPLVVMLTVLLNFWAALMVGRSRGKTGVRAPAVTGHPDFERAFRVQMNTVEQTVMFLPTLYLCGMYFRMDVAVVLGGVWLLGRVLFALAYYQDSAKRGPGFLVAMAAFAGLFLGAGVGIVGNLLG
jgi:glutathione S-transferase